MSTAVGGPPSADNLSPMNGRNQTIPAVPSVSSPMAVNGNNVGHDRTPSFTINSNSAPSFNANGGAVGAGPTAANKIQFGAMPTSAAVPASQSSTNLGVAPTHPRSSSPQTSPSPIPQPAPSGGRPPSSLQGPGNGVSFGQLGGEASDPTASPNFLFATTAKMLTSAQRPARAMPQGLGPGPQPIHLRRDSSQSSHGDMGNTGMPPGPGRGGYHNVGGRGRGGYPNQYGSHMAFSPNQNFRQTPNGRGMPLQQGYPPRQQGPYPGSPSIGTRSPAMMNANPATPQMNQTQMMYGGVPGPHNGYPSHMGGPYQVNRRVLSSIPDTVAPNVRGRGRGGTRGKYRDRGTQSWRDKKTDEAEVREKATVFPRDPALDVNQPSSTRRATAPVFQAGPPLPPPSDLSPESGNFERFLTGVSQNMQGQIQYAIDPSIQQMYQNHHFMQQQQVSGAHMPPQSPRPPYAQNPSAPYMQQSYSGQGQSYGPQPLSRTPSQMSGIDRPNSSLGQPPTPSMASTAGQPPSARTTSSPAPKSAFTLPPKKSAAIVIKNAQGEAVTFSKPMPSPAKATPSPAKSATPPVPTPSTPAIQPIDEPHNRTESVNVKSNDEKKREMQEAVAKKLADEAKAKQDVADEEAKAAKLKEDEANRASEALKAEEAAAIKAKEDAEAAKATEEASKAEEERVANEKKEEDTKAAQAASEAASEPSHDASKPIDDDEPDFDAIEAELAALEAEEERKEAEYQKKKAVELEARKQTEREEEAAYEASLKQMEREAEEREEAAQKKAEAEAAAGSDNDEPKGPIASLKAEETATPPSGDSTGMQTPEESGAVTPISDISMGPPARANRNKKPAELTLNTTKAVEPPQPSAALKSLQSARFLEDPAKIEYPSAIASPNPALNTNAPSDRKFKYNKEFLMQFQAVFKEKPSVDWDIRVRETLGDGGDSTASARPSSARTPSGMGGRSVSNRPSVAAGAFSGQMGTFGASRAGPTVLPPGTTSAQRFAMSNAPAAAQRPQNPFEQFGRPVGQPLTGSSNISRSTSSNMIGGMSPRSGAPSRGGRQDSKRGGGKSSRRGQEEDKTMPLTVGMDLGPIQVSQGGWKARSLAGPGAAGPALGGDGYMAPDVVQRKVKSNLNKMTPEKFDKISDQILEIAAQSKDETDGRTLRQVIQLTFEKATDEAHWASMYAMFCKRMLESMSADIKDENIKDKNGSVVTGGNLFRKYLLNRCQEEFERGWKTNLPEKPEGQTEEAAMLSDEYYIEAAAKRRGLGLVKFIGELYKLGMLTERIMHECLKKLLDYEGMPDEAEVESLTSLLRTVGAHLDNPASKAQPAMNVYFARMNDIMNMPDLPSRLRFMLLDVIELRRKGWSSKEDNKGPKTIQEIRAEAEAQARQAEAARLASQANRGGGGRMPMGRGDARSFSYNQMPPPDRSADRVGTDDLRRLGNRALRTPSHAPSGPGGQFGPTSLLSGRTNSGPRRNLGPGGNLLAQRENSGNSSRTATPPVAKDESSTNAFRYAANPPPQTCRC